MSPPLVRAGRRTTFLPADLLYRIFFELILKYLHSKLLLGLKPWNSLRSLSQVSQLFRGVTLRACTFIFNTHHGTPESLPLRSIMQSISCLCPVSPSNIRPLLPRMASSVMLNLVDPLRLTLPAEWSFGMLYIYHAVDFSLALYHCSTFRGWSHFHKVSPIFMSELLDALRGACMKSLALCARMKHQRISSLSYELVLKYCTESYFSALLWNAAHQINLVPPEERSTADGQRFLEKVFNPLESREALMLPQIPEGVMLNRRLVTRTVLQRSSIIAPLESLRDGDLGTLSARADLLLSDWNQILKGEGRKCVAEAMHLSCDESPDFLALQ